MGKYLLICFFLCSAGVTLSQDSLAQQPLEVQYDEREVLNPLVLDAERLEDFRSDSEFDYTEVPVEDTWWERFKRWLGRMWNRFWNWLLGDGEISGFWAVLIRLLPYLIVLAIILFVGWLFYKLNPGSKLLKSKETPEVFFTEEEEIIKTKNIQDLIQKALADKNYRLAVRYYYLLILKRLSEAELITYEFDKTNSDYLLETQGDGVYHDFAKATNLYDYIWYGNFEVTETDYSKAQTTFQHLEGQIPVAVE